jgi:glycolate oxidase FAD binding subunit
MIAQWRPAGGADLVGGVPARFVAAPSGVEELAELMSRCTDDGLAAVVRGDGSKLDWGHAPSTVDVVIDTAGLAGVSEHQAGDLVATVGAGTPVHVLQAVLARAGQRLALDPPSPGATVGGVLAAGETGPLGHRYGGPRDLLIGVEFVRADGTVAHSGGRVVKNVAGYDVGKLLCGSYGTLGVITSATFRLHPLPAHRSWVIRPVRTPGEVGELITELTDGTLEPTAIEVDLPSRRPHPIPRQRNGTAAPAAGQLAVLFEGSLVGVPARCQATVEMLGGDSSIVDEQPDWWGRYPFGPDDIALRLCVPAADLHAVIYALRDAAGIPVPVRGSAGIGVVHAALPGTLPADRAETIVDSVRTTLLARGGSCVVLTAPDPLREELDLWGPVPGLDLMRRVKERFDPARLLSPGRFVGGI